jgi:hypothetical protein
MPSLTLMNRTAYHTPDLERLFARGLWAMGCRKSKVVRVLPTRGDSHGEALVGSCSRRQRGMCEGTELNFHLPSPEKMTLRRLARLFEHEALHSLGKDHSEMTRSEYWSLGPVPRWARGARVRYGRDGTGGVLR